ncbi:MAG: CD225/dispanin family protein [Segniliparus sp.]|uniref:CD225/dispanin family protein n=1 Tax=Segniliparus sp. TaxID=2804064 RepID=UPI003F403121
MTQSSESPEPQEQPAPGAVTHVTTNLPQSNIGWAVASVVFFWPLAFSAFANAWKVYPLWSAGDAEGAEQAAAKTKLLGKISLLIGLVLIFLFVAFRIAAAFWFWHHGGDAGQGGWGHHHGGWDQGGWDHHHGHGGWGYDGGDGDGPAQSAPPVQPAPPAQPVPVQPVPPVPPVQPAPRI